MSTQARLLLFVLSALCTVIIPAVMVSTYHTLEQTSRDGQTILAVLGLVPLTVVLIVCFAGLFYSIFRVRGFPSNRRKDD